MLPNYILALSDPQATLETVGGKGESLARLVRAGVPVPDGFHITTAAYRQFVVENALQPVIDAALEKADPSNPASWDGLSGEIQAQFAQGKIPAHLGEAIRLAYAELAGKQPAVAVRSSATAEDLPDLSFAGQQETYLNIRGADAVLEAVKCCWSSLWTGRAFNYRLQHGIDQSALSLAVVVQLLIPAETSGILFTAHPVTGRRDQAMVSAAWGLGDLLVGGQVTPDTWIVDHGTGKVIERQTADKQVMTVCKEAGVEQQPVPEALRCHPVLSDWEVVKLVHLGLQIESLYGMPVDIEWARAGNQTYVVQARPVTALPEPPLPTRWPLPKGAYAALRNNIVELMADPLTPLFDTLGRKAINASMHRLMTLFFGRKGIMPEEIIISVNGYAYNNGSLKPGSLVRVLLGSIGTLKRMFRGAVERWTETGRPRYIEIVQAWQARPWRVMSANQLLGAVRELSEAAFDAYGSLISGVIPAAWISEALFTASYNRLIKRGEDPAASTFLMGFDSLPIRAEKSLYDLGEWIRLRPSLAAAIQDTPAAELVAMLKNGRRPHSVEDEDWREWQSHLQAHLDLFGHMIYNFDFANPVSADDPAAVLETCKLFAAGLGQDPYLRQQAWVQRRELGVYQIEARLKGLRLKLFHKFLQPAQRFAPLREDGLAEIGLAYPLLRQMLLELGRRFTNQGVIAAPADIFWLYEDEVEQAAASLDSGEAAGFLGAAIPARKAAWRAAKRAAPPERLPQMKIKRGARVRNGRRLGDAIRGVPASPGRATAAARILDSPEDFSHLKPGDVLVASITTPAWTPLFARAAAIVTDVGGPLSHGSIVAREYGIPAVLGTGDATRRIQDGQIVTVDGDLGKVFLGKN